MDIQQLTDFFMWCTIINGGMFVLSTIMILCAPDFVYGIQSKLFPISRDAFNTIVYCFLGLFKLVFIVFNVVPYVALLLVG